MFTGSGQTQYKPTGDDGIAASPKMRQQIEAYRRNHAPAPAPAEVASMPCAKCKDKVTQKVDYTARGQNKPIITVSTHLCPGCGTDWKTVGVGKAKQSVAAHKCTDCRSENLACCNITKGGEVASKGMEKAKNLEIAPLK
jgi:hypothetical protein